MNISPLIDLEKLGLKDFGRFTKTRVLKGENIFPALLITSIEQLIIKKCFSFAFEVFFGLLFEVGEQFNLTVASETKLAISEFTCSIQSQRLKDFRLLQEKEEFFNIVNELGRFLDKSNDPETLNCLIETFAELKVNLMVKSEFYARETRKTESFHSNLHVLKHKQEFYLMLERDDYMDDEAIEEEERLRRLEMEENERIKREKIERKFKKLEDKRKREQIMMKDEDVKRILYLKQEKELEEKDNLNLDKFEYYDRILVLDEFEYNKKAAIGLASEEKFFAEFKRKERKKEKVLRELIKNEENYFERFYMKISKKMGKNLIALEREEKFFVRFQGIEKSFCNKSMKAFANEDKIVNTLQCSVENIRAELGRTIGLNEKQVKKFNILEERLREDTIEKLAREERLSKKNEYNCKLEQKSQEEKKKADDKYQEVLRRIELQKIAEKQRQAKEKQVRMEREQKRKAEITKIEVQEDSLNLSESSEPPISEESLIHESKIIEAMVLICGSYFCTQCFRMLKRSSLFLKCGDCCTTAFKSISKLKTEDYPHGKIPPGSLCVGCNSSIIRGEIVRCICCYIRIEFLKDYTPINCNSCMDPERIDWVDTYIGSKYELVNCGFCERLVNYAYVIEICITCHDQICLHCLRKNHFLASSVCNECHSRRQVNPYLKIRKNS